MIRFVDEEVVDASRRPLRLIFEQAFRLPRLLLSAAGLGFIHLKFANQLNFKKIKNYTQIINKLIKLISIPPIIPAYFEFGGFCRRVSCFFSSFPHG